MKMNKRILSLCLALIMMITGTVVGSLAFLTDKSPVLVNVFELAEITYKLILEPNAPAGYEDSDISMPEISPADTQKVAAGHADFGLNKDPGLTGYTFLGWYSAAENGDKLHDAGTESIEVGYNEPYTVTDKDQVSLTLYAHWAPITYTVTYNANGPEEWINGTTEDSVHTYDVTKNLTLNGYTRTGYSFKGWAETADGMVKFTDGESVINLADEQGAVVELFAVWEANDVKYVVNHWQQNIDAPQTPENETNYTLKDSENCSAKADSKVTPAVKTYEGFTSPDAVEVTVKPDGSTVVDYYYTRNYYDVTLEMDTGIANVAGAGSYHYGKSVTIDATLANGYEWENWTGDKASNAKQVTFTMPAADVTNKAWAKPIVYNITYDLKGGALPSGKTNPATYTVETETFTLNNPTRTGYTFTGWTGTGLNAATTTVTIAKGSTGDRAYTATWSANDVPYVVKHWQQNLGAPDTQNSTNYTLKESENKTAKADSKVTPPVKTYTGFTSPSAQTVTVKADGSTVVNYYYTRNSYTVTLNKGTGISGVSGAGTYQYGATVNIDATVSGNYKWVNWTGYKTTTTKSYSFTMPAQDVSLTANAQILIVNYKVQHWQQKLDAGTAQNSTNYTLVTADTQTFTANAGSSVTPAVKTYTGFKSPSAQTVTVKADGSTVVNYYYTRNSYKVTLIKGTGISGVSGADTYQYGASVTINATVSTGYTWSKWTGTHSTTTQKYTFTMPANDVTDTANATINKYTVTVKAGTGVSSVSGGGTYNYNSSVTINATLKTGYRWVNWTGSSTVSNQKYTFNMPAGDRTWTANGTPITYYVKYNGNGATGGSTAQSTHTYDTAKNLTANGFTRTGYTFAGWTTNANGTGTAYSNNQSVKNLTSTHGATINLYAKWTPNTYKVVYHSNDIASGDSKTITDTVTYDQSYTIRGANTFSFGNNLLGGWSTYATSNVDGNSNWNRNDIPIPGVRVASYLNKSCGQSVKNLTATNGGTIHLYAIWTPKTVEVWGYSQSGGYPYGLLEQNYAPYEIASPQASPSGYLWQEHPSSAQDGLKGYNNIRKDDLHAYPVGYNSIYRYQYAGVIFDITYMRYFRFDIRMANGTLDQLKQMTNGQIEFTSSGTCDNSEISATWSSVWANSYYVSHYNQDTGNWISIYVPMSIFGGSTNKAAINFVGLYWTGGTDIGLNAFMCDPRFEYDLPSGAVKFSLDKPSEPEPVEFTFDISIDELGAFANDMPEAGKDFTMTFTPAEGYEMPENVIVTIDGVQHLYPSVDLPKGTDVEGRECYVLTVSGELITEGCRMHIEAIVESVEDENEPAEPETEPTEPTEPETEPTEPVTKETSPEETMAATEPTVAAMEPTIATVPVDQNEEEEN